MMLTGMLVFKGVFLSRLSFLKIIIQQFYSAIRIDFMEFKYGLEVGSFADGTSVVLSHARLS